MSTAVAEPTATPTAAACPRCGAALSDGQDWCLSCGTAVTTRVEPPPSWRTPVAIAAGVMALAGAALIVALVIAAGSGPDRVVQTTAAGATPAVTPGTAAPPTAPPVATTPPATTTPAATTPADGAQPAPGAQAPGTQESPGGQGSSPNAGSSAGKVQSWPAGRSGYTVVLISATSRGAAETKARQIADTGASVGVLESAKYQTLRAGYFVVFSGVYDTLEEAQKAVQKVRGAAPSAYARQVKPR